VVLKIILGNRPVNFSLQCQNQSQHSEHLPSLQGVSELTQTALVMGFEFCQSQKQKSALPTPAAHSWVKLPDVLGKKSLHFHWFMDFFGKTTQIAPRIWSSSAREVMEAL